MKQYSEQFDAYYDDETNEWLDTKCDDPECEYCVNRPERPINVDDFPFGCDYWYTQYRRSYSKYLAEAIREKRKFSRYDYLQI